MPFSEIIKREAMIACGRRCCICHKSCGNKMEVHHIIPHSEGGEDTFENAIPLCFDCHAEAGHYNPKHPKGIKFSKEELKKHRDNWYKKVKEESLHQEDKIEHIREKLKFKVYHQKNYENILLKRITKGKELISYIQDICALDYDYDEPQSREEVDIIAKLMDHIKYLVDFLDDYDPAERIVLSFDLTDLINKLESLNYYLYCAIEMRKTEDYKGTIEDFPTLLVRIVSVEKANSSKEINNETPI